MDWLYRIYAAIFRRPVLPIEELDTTEEHFDETSDKYNSENLNNISKSEATVPNSDVIQEAKAEQKTQQNIMSQPFKMSTKAALSRHAAFAAETLPEAQSCTIEDNGKVVAKQTLVKFSPNQAYCVISEFDSRFDDNEIRVEEDKENPLKLKLISIEEEKVKKHLLPIFVRFHHSLKQRSAESHLSDRTFEAVMGRINMELKKNITLDSFERISSWRDEAGFVVADRNQYELVTFDAKKLLADLQPADVPISSYSAADLDSLLDFDHSVCGANRETLIAHLTQNDDVLLVKTASEVNGFLAAKNGHVHVLYSETIELAHALLKEYLEKSNTAKVTFFTRAKVWETEPVERRAVYRYHTRAVPTQLKWNKVYVANFGVHLL